MTDAKTSNAERVWCLDYARYWLVLIVVVFHCLLSQLTFFPSWPVADERQTEAANWLIFWAHTFQMPLLFFIAGYFALQSLRPKGTAEFIRAKFFRLIVPAGLVLVFLNPIHRYLFHYTRSFQEGIGPMSYPAYWVEFFRHANLLEYGNMVLFEFSLMHLWFVTLLFLFFAATALAVARKTRGAEQSVPRHLPTTTRQAIFSTAALAVFVQWAAGAILLIWATMFDWVMIGSVILFEVPSVALHVGYFGLGIVAYRRGWLARPEALGPPWLWLLAVVPLTALELFLNDWSITELAFLESYGFSLSLWSVRTINCCCYLFLLLSVATRYFNKPSPVQQHFASLSYRVYLLHMAVVFLVQFLFWNVPGLSTTTVLIGTIVVTVLCTYALALALNRPAAWYAAWTSGRRRKASCGPGEPVLIGSTEMAHGIGQD